MSRSFLNRIFAEESTRGAIDGGIGARSKFRRNPKRAYLGLLCLWGAVSAVFGHNLYISSTEVYFADDFLATMTSRASSRQSLIQVGDEFWIVQKGTPGPGTTLGVGGYLTFYVPTGYQVVDAAYVTPCSTSTDPRGFTTIPIKGQGPISVGSGKTATAALTTSELIGYTYPAANVLGVRESPVTSAGLNRGTIAGVYADTGIFYSVSSRTAYTTTLAALGNKAGDSVIPLNLFDSDQERAFGLAQNAILNSAGGGNTPWGMGSAVAGPESGYAWCFDYAVYNATSGSATVKGQAATTVGPWNRIRYAGSQISKDIAGNTDTTIGYAGVSAGTTGYNFSTAGALPTTVNAVRFSVGQLQLGLPEYVAIKVKTTASFSSLNTIVGEALGGDAAGADTGKDNLWKYYNPTISKATPSVLLQKKAANSLLATNGTTYFDLTFANAGTNALTNVVIKDTLPVGLGYVSSTPTAASTTGGVITWNLGVVSNGAVQTLKLNVRATNTLGILTNTVTASATGQTNLATAYDTVVVTNLAYLTLNKTVASPTVPPGGTNRYTVTVSNVGNVTNGIPLVITDSLPSGFSYVAFISASLNGTNYVATNSFISVSTSNVAEPVFTINRAILANESCTITFDAKVASTNALGTYYNQAEMTYGSVSLPPTPLAPVTVQSNPVLSWSSISPLVYGVAITPSNALYPTSNVAGSFTFAPTNGSILPVGTNSLVANFMPSNTTSYSSGTITNTVVITKAILTTTCQPTNKVYGQTNPPLSYLLTGFVNGENSNSLTTQPVASTTVILSTPVGVYTNAITATGGTANNYSFTYVPANFTVTKAPSTITVTGITSLTYNTNAQGPDSNTKTGSTGSVTYSYSGTGGTSYGPSATKPTVVGSYTATATLASDSNYDGAVSTFFSFSIGKAPSTISATGSTSFTYNTNAQGPDSNTKTGSTGSVTYSYSGASGTLYGPSATKPTVVGSYTATATLAADSNYDGAVSTPYSFSIGKAPSTISATGSTSFTYSGVSQGPDMSSKTGSTGGVTYSYSGASGTSYGASATKPTAVGSYTATATLASDSNYDGAVSTPYSFSIGKAPSTISVTGLSSFTYSGSSQGPDTSSKTGSTGGVTYSYSGAGGTSYVASATKPTAVGSYTATATLAADSNYNGAVSDALLFTIAAKVVTGSFTANDKEYDGNNSATVASRLVSGKVGSEDVSLSGGTATFDNASTGIGKTVTLAGATLAGTAASNYTLGSISTNTAKIAAKNLTGSFTANDKEYDGNNSATVASRLVSGKVGSEDVSLSGGTATFDNASTGTGKTVTLAGATLAGTAASNYTLGSVSTTTAKITEKTLNITAEAKSKVYGAVNPALTGSVVSGAVAGESFTVTASTTADASSAPGTYSIVPDVTGSTLSNYTVSKTNGMLTVTPASSTITMTGSTSFTYNTNVQGPDTSNKTGSSGAVTYSYSGAGGTIYLASATKPTDVGSYEATASLAADSNYEGATSSAYGFSIGKDGSTINVTGLTSFTYNTNAQGPDSNTKTGSSGAVTYSYSGASGTSYVASATKPTAVGSYTATATLAADSNYDGATSSAYGFSIVKDGSTISVTGLSSFTYNTNAQGPDSNTKTGSSGAVTYSYSGAGGTSYGPIGTKPTDVGSYEVTASLAADSNYDGATSSAYGFSIGKDGSTISVTGLTSFTYSGVSQGPGTSNKTGSTGSVTFSYSGTGLTSYGPSPTKPTDVGSYEATATLAADSNYEGATSSAYGFSIGKDGSTISVTGLTSFTYSGVSQGPDTSNKTGSSGAVSFSYSGTGLTSYGPSPTKPTDVGSYEATASLAADSNYDGATSTAYGFTILAKPITITADPKSKISGDSDPTLTSQFTVGSIEPGDVLSGFLDRVKGETPGKYAIISTFSNGNYSITFVSADLTIQDGDNPTAQEDHLVSVPIKTSKFYVSEVLANDTDLRNRTLTITATSSSSSKGGTVVLKGGWILYTPPAGLAQGVEDSFTYTLSNGVGSAQGTVTLLAAEWPMTDAMNILSVTDSAPGKVVTFSAIPNFVYEVFATSSLAPANWIKLGDYTADAQGILRLNDVAAGSSRFYRMRSQP